MDLVKNTVCSAYHCNEKVDEPGDVLCFVCATVDGLDGIGDYDLYGEPMDEVEESN